MKRKVLGILIIVALTWCTRTQAQILIPATTLVNETFNSIGNASNASLPLNWKITSAGTGISSGWSTGTNVTVVNQAANSGTPIAGGGYNWGSASGTDRAIGFMSSGSYVSPNAIMAWYRNATGVTQNSVTLTFQVERYRTNTDPFTSQFYYSIDGVNWLSQSAGDVTSSEFPTGVSAYNFSTPKTVTKSVTINVGSLGANSDIYFKWVFNTGTNSQGVGIDNVAVFFGAATPVMSATLKDILQVDNGILNQFNEGDGIRYQTIIKNNGTGDANSLQITLPTPPTNTTMVAGSIKTSALAIDDNYTASFNTPLSIAAASGVLVNDIGIPTPTAVISYGSLSDATIFAAGAAGVSEAGGTVTLNADGSFNYTPPAGFSGTDRIKYITGNGNLPNNDGIVSINVSPDISISVTTADPLCNNGTNGSITINASGGNGTLLYSITGAGGTYQASNTFTGLSAGPYTVAVKDQGGYIKTTNVTLNNPALLVVSGSSPLNIIYTTSISTTTYTKSGGTGAVTWSSAGLPAGLTLNATSGDLTGAPTVTGVFNTTITATDANGCTASKSVTINVAPKLVSDNFTGVVGNTQLVSNGHSTPTTPFTSDATNIVTNDQSNAAVTITPVTNAATANGGTITIDATGKFTYSPPNGFIGTDSYNYTGTSNGVSATATINFTISNMVWFVNNTYSGGSGVANGSSHRPYTDLTNASASAQINQIIFIHPGSGSTSGNATLKSGQTLRGAGSTLTVGALTIPASSKPVLSGTVTLANSVNVDGFDINTATLTAITNNGVTVTSAVVNVGNVTSTTGSGVSITGTGNSVTMTLATLNTSGAGNAINLVNTAGTVNINGGSLTGGAGSVIIINGGTLNFTFSGSALQATASQPLITINGGHTTGTVLFQTGTLSATNGTGLQFDNADGVYNFLGTTNLNGGDAGIDILNGSAGTFNFATSSGTIAITSPSGIGFNVGGTANTASITYNGNITQANNAALISVTNHSTNSIVFSSGNTLSATNGIGIQFDNADGTYSFNGTVSLNGGDAGVDILNGSAGTFTFPSTTTITNPTGTAFNVGSASASSGGSCNITFNGSISKSSSGRIVEIQQKTGGTCTFTGAITGSSNNTGVNLASNAGSTFNFNGGLTLDGSLTNFSVNASGTINITGTNNIGNTTVPGTTALTIANTIIGSSGVTFRKVSCSGGTNGINLSSTGSGAFIVSGDGGATNNNSGGLIQNCTSHGVSLSGVANVRLNYLGINNNLGSGISGGTINGFQLSRCNISGNGNDAAFDESGINITDVTGTAIAGTNPTSINNCVITNNWEFEIQITNSTGTLTDFQMNNCTVSSNGLSGSHGNLVNFLAIGSAVMTLNTVGGTFTGAAPNTANGINADAGGGTLTANISNATLTNNFAAISVSNSSSGNIVFNLSGNTATNNYSHGLNLFVNASSTGSVNGKFLNNIVGTLGVAGSGSQFGYGIRVQNEGSTVTGNALNVLMSGNTVQETLSFASVNVFTGIASQTYTRPMNVTVINNTLRNSGARAIVVQQNNNTNTTGSAGSVCANISGNVMSNIVGQAGDGTYIRLRQFTGGTFTLTQASLAALEGANTCTGGCTGKVSVGGTIIYNQPACIQPN